MASSGKVARVGILDTLTGRTPGVVAFSETPVAVAGTLSASSPITDQISTVRAARIAQGIALSIPAVRKAQHVIAGTIGTFGVTAWSGNHQLETTDPRVAWLQQPDPRRTLQWILTKTIQDVIWRDRSVWRITDRTVSNLLPAAIERIHPSRIDTISDPRDDELVNTWLIDGTPANPHNLIVFDGAGMGGLQRYGFELLTLYGELQAAAGRYAKAPHPHAILKNHGADLNNDEITALLDEWEKARYTRSVGYLNDVVDYDTYGWNARELQLTEAREHAAVEVARLFGLPAKSLDAKTGDSMTYGNVVEWRRAEVDAIRPWMEVFEQTVSMNSRSGRTAGVVVPRGIRILLDVADYLREPIETRMTTWATALAAQILTLDEVRSHEPLARS